MKLRNFSVVQRLAFLVLLVAGLLLVMTVVVLQQHYEAQKDKAYEETKHIVESAYSVLEHFSTLSENGDMTIAEAQMQAKGVIAAIRYDDGNYLWIQDDTPAMVMHPLKPALDGQDLTDFKDANGDKFFVTMARLVKSENEGFVPYVWPLPNSEKAVDKISYVKRFAPWQWTVGTGIYLTRLDAAFSHIRNVFIGLGVVCLILVILFAWLIGQSIITPLRATTERMKDISQGQGDLTRELPENGNDEIARLSRHYNAFVAKVRESLQSLHGAIEQVAQEGSRLADIRQSSESQAQTQSHNAIQVASAMEQMTVNIGDVSRHAAEADHSTESAGQSAKAGIQAVAQSVTDIQSLNQSIESVVNTVSQLAQQSDKIGSVLDVIRGISEQTNLLALNAAIEAARAGEQGRGFAVVADEVRTLASRTGQSTDEIQQMIQELQSGSSAAVNAVKTSQSAVDSTVANVKQADETLRTLLSIMSDIAAKNRHIAEATGQQSDAAQEVNLRINELSESARHTVSNVEEMTQTSIALAGHVEQARQAMRKFQY
ncbi:methyl-accepting chemotaxis protein [Alteromonas sp. RKMC-009]|uniref:methyl-accepting chemotaxis protein n=1 Tax=Alteromonas sp. RKMC-009 TaxID=2267264 RepID=UPI000E6A6B12|nr:methyl-accepting chemotaxis protein [Alteromonas sp. RKMC-009]AYA63123.1 methyl-accepting chemotaxis protein [Alteromonas sp. RKMC-009]